MEENNSYAFTPEDIIVWNGIVCKFGYIKHLVDSNDKIRKANKEEVKSYLEV